MVWHIYIKDGVSTIKQYHAGMHTMVSIFPYLCYTPSDYSPPFSFSTLLQVTLASGDGQNSSLAPPSVPVPESPWQKRVVPTLSEVEEKTRQKADHHQRMALSNVGNSYDQTVRFVREHEKRTKWSEREVILFNKDVDGALRQAEYYQNKFNQLENEPVAQQKVYENMMFWSQRASEWVANEEGPLYAKHHQELVHFLTKKEQKYHRLGMPNRRLKWQNQAETALTGNILDADRKAMAYQIKAMKAAQNKQDWLRLNPARNDPFPIKTSLEDYRHPNKIHLLTKSEPNEDSNSNEQSETEDVDLTLEDPDERTYREGKSHQALRLRPSGHATNRNRIRRKIEQNMNDVHSGFKWRDRRNALDENENELYDYRQDAIRHYHNKEIKKRWQQLRWASSAHHMKQMKQLRGQADVDNLASEMSSFDVGEGSGSGNTH